MLAGLALQVSPSSLRLSVTDVKIFAWVVFIAFLLVAMVRAYRFDNLKSKRYDPMRWMLWAILFSALMLIWRAIFRCTEAATGKSSFHSLPPILTSRLLERPRYQRTDVCLFRVPTRHPRCWFMVYRSPESIHRRQITRIRSQG